MVKHVHACGARAPASSKKPEIHGFPTPSIFLESAFRNAFCERQIAMENASISDPIRVTKRVDSAVAHIV